MYLAESSPPAGRETKSSACWFECSPFVKEPLDLLIVRSRLICKDIIHSMERMQAPDGDSVEPGMDDDQGSQDGMCSHSISSKKKGTKD